MTQPPFPDDPNAEICVHTGARAYAAAGWHGANRVTGWYGSTMVDLDDFFLVLDPAFPEGPVCDAVLREALADGRLYDPDPIRNGKVALADVPDAVLAALVRIGVERGRRGLAESEEAPSGLHVPPIHDVVLDDPLSLGLMRGVMGGSRHPGPDLELAGVLMAVLHAARGRDLDGKTLDGAVEAFVGRLRDRDGFLQAILAA